MKLRVRYFASVREWAGLREEDLEVPNDCTAADLRRAVAERHGKQEKTEHLLVAVNGSFVDPKQVLRPGDDVAVFPPVSGG
jgi:molybdopterin converting factor subunit 1